MRLRKPPSMVRRLPDWTLPVSLAASLAVTQVKPGQDSRYDSAKKRRIFVHLASVVYDTKLYARHSPKKQTRADWTMPLCCSTTVYKLSYSVVIGWF